MKKLIGLMFLASAWITGVQAQWSGEAAENLRLIDRSVYSTEAKMLSDGSWFLYHNGPSGGTTLPYLQYFDKNGVALWESDLLICEERTKTYNVYNNLLFVDRDENAIVVNQDLRREDLNTYTAYKIDKTGEHRWNHSGISLHGDELPSFCAALQIIQMSDGSYVFAWEEETFDADNIQLRMQRLSADGERLWGEGKVFSMEGTALTYPYLVDAGNNECILLYAQGAMQELYARKLDFDGNDVWQNPVLVYGGSLPTTPLWTWMKVIPVEGGLVAAWPGYDPEQPLLAWIKADGTHAFTEGSKGLRMGYTPDYRCAAPDVVFDAETRTFYSVWREFDPNTQAWQRIAAQKISAEGELLWDPMGVDIAPLEHHTLAYYSLQLAPKGALMAAYMEMFAGDNMIDAYAVLVDAEGKYVWQDTSVSISSRETGGSKSNMVSLPMREGQWIFFWNDFRDFDNLNTCNVYGQNLHLDGSLGNTSAANERAVEEASSALRVFPNPVGTSARIAWNHEGTGQTAARIELLDVKGASVGVVYNGILEAGENLVEWQRPANLVSGVYLMRAIAGGQVCYEKIILR